MRDIRGVAAGLALAVLAGCAGGESAPVAEAATGIGASGWELAEIGGRPVDRTEGSEVPGIRFDPVEGKVSGFSGCNRFFGSYQLDGSGISFGPMGNPDGL